MNEMLNTYTNLTLLQKNMFWLVIAFIIVGLAKSLWCLKYGNFVLLFLEIAYTNIPIIIFILFMGGIVEQMFIQGGTTGICGAIFVILIGIVPELTLIIIADIKSVKNYKSIKRKKEQKNDNG